MLGLEVEVVGVGLGPQLDFLHLDHRLLLPRILLPAGLEVLVLAEVHDPADRRHRLARHFHQVHVPLPRQIEGLGDGEDPQLLAIGAHHPDFPHANPLVDANILRRYSCRSLTVRVALRPSDPR